jgi:hypothetical protein
MTMKSHARRFRRFAALLAAPVLALAACGDGTTNPPGQEVVPSAVILNSVDRSLTVTPVQGNTAVSQTIGLGAQGTPVNLAVRGARAVVPMGTYPFAAVVNLVSGQVALLPLPANSGATGAAFVNDQLAVVANPGRNSISPMDVATGIVGPEVAVGTYPQFVLADESRVYVINANLVNFAPAGPGSVTVLSSGIQVLQTVQLTGINPGPAVIRGNRLYVLNAGTFGGNNGTMSVVNLGNLTEERLVTGFGEFPGSLALGADGNLYVGVYGTGVLVWNPDTGFVRGPNNPIVPAGAVPVSAVGIDLFGRLHTTNPGSCQSAGSTSRLNPTTGALERTTPTGVCPFAIGFGLAAAPAQ